MVNAIAKLVSGYVNVGIGSTKAIVDAWSAANQFQKFIKWASSFAIIGAIVSWVVTNAPKLGG